MSRRHLWLQLLIGWLPVWVVITSLIVTAHSRTSVASAAFISLRMIVAAAILALPVQRLTERFPWRSPVTPGFVGLHLLAAIVYSVAWVLLNSLIESVVRGSLVIVVGVGLSSFLVLGVWMYVMIAGVSYTIQSTERAARAEALAAQAQLSALRSQLNPHFLFNALHTVVQLIPRRPREAAEAAEQVAALLRTTIEEDRDVIPVSEELAFVERYLAVESIRFGDRLRFRFDVDEPARAAIIPSFALQSLVENAIRHGAAPNIEATDLLVEARLGNGMVELVVSDNGAGATIDAMKESTGTGIRRLRERLDALYQGRASMHAGPASGGGFRVSLAIPQVPTD